MHDFSTAQAFADAILKKFRRKKVGKMEIHISLGALLGLNPGQVEFWLAELIRKKLGDDVELRIFTEVTKPEIKCGCGFEGVVDSFEASHEMAHHGIYEMKCPKCGAQDYQLVKGLDRSIRGIRAE